MLYDKCISIKKKKFKGIGNQTVLPRMNGIEQRRTETQSVRWVFVVSFPLGSAHGERPIGWAVPVTVSLWSVDCSWCLGSLGGGIAKVLALNGPRKGEQKITMVLSDGSA